MSTPQAMRFNYGKLQLSMVPPSLAAYCAAPLMYGAIKYERDNWRRGFNWTSIIDSLQRHLDQFKIGEDFDQESKLHHMAHVACNVAFLIEHIEQGLGRDDRTQLLHTEVRFLRQSDAARSETVSEGGSSPDADGDQQSSSGS